MGWIQTTLIALIPLALIAWRLRRLLRVLRGERSMWYKVAVSAIIVVGLISRVARWFSPSGTARASSVTQAGEPARAAGRDHEVDSLIAQRATDANALIVKGEAALAKCDTAAARYAFQQVAGAGVDMMTVDSLAGDPLFYQSVALAGLRDSASAAVLSKEAARLDRQRHVAANPEHDTVMKRVITAAAKKC